ncbi:hypothetical protein JYT96_03100 [Gammaproteobacteria bacterium AH-315-C21]|nr:hypothetical protein [Gammaproteobacteria bacterium AH-315-C21]
MSSISRYFFSVVFAGFLVATIASCGLLKGGKAPYEKSTVDAPLKLPEGLQEPNHDAGFNVPEEID